MLQFIFAVAAYSVVIQRLINQWILFADGTPVDLNAPMPPLNSTTFTQVKYECLFYTSPNEGQACSATTVAFAFTVASTAVGFFLYCSSARTTGTGAACSVMASFSLAVVNLALWAWAATLITDNRVAADDFGLPGQSDRYNCFALAWTCVAFCGAEVLVLCCMCGIGARKGAKETGDLQGGLRSFSIRNKPSSSMSDLSRMENQPPPPPPRY